LNESILEEVIAEYKKLVKAETGQEFPQDVYQQLKLAISAVFKSWNNPRAITYRRQYHIPDDLGTAVNIQQMVSAIMVRPRPPVLVLPEILLQAKKNCTVNI